MSMLTYVKTSVMGEAYASSKEALAMAKASEILNYFGENSPFVRDISPKSGIFNKKRTRQPLLKRGQEKRPLFKEAFLI